MIIIILNPNQLPLHFVLVTWPGL